MVASYETTGWLVSADQGKTLAEVNRAGGPNELVELAQAIARIQRAVSLPKLLELPLRVFRPEEAVANLDDQLDQLSRLPPSHPTHVDRAWRDQALSAIADQVNRWHEVDPGIELSVDHNDLHIGNVFPGPLISDWADAVISHPFSSMRTLCYAAQHISSDLRAEAENAYLSVWGDPKQLRPALQVASQLAVCQRLNSWCTLQDADALAEYSSYIIPLITEIGQEPTTP